MSKAPFDELVTFAVTVEFQFHVQIQRIVLTEIIDLDGVIHHQVDRNQRLDLFRVLAGFDGYVSHGGKVDKQRNTGEILQNHTCDDERNFVCTFFIRLPVSQLAHVFFRNFLAVTIAKYGLENNTDGDWQAGQVETQFFPEIGNGVEVAFLFVGDRKFFIGILCETRHENSKYEWPFSGHSSVRLKQKQ